jgi:hypothetical protein
MSHGFKSEMLAGLVRDGLASAATESMEAGGAGADGKRVETQPKLASLSKSISAFAALKRSDRA